MARDRKRFNAKARLQKGVHVDDSTKKQINLDKTVFETSSSKYDESNALALPSKKRKTKIQKVEQGPQRFLTKKHRKKLELIVARREKKSLRADLLTELQKHQIPSETLDSFTPLVQIQTEGLKKLFSQQISDAYQNGLEGEGARVEESSDKNKDKRKGARPKSSLKGAKHLKFQSWSGRFTPGKKDPKVLGLEIVESSSEESEEEEDKLVGEVKEEIKSEEEMESDEDEVMEVSEESEEEIEDVKDCQKEDVKASVQGQEVTKENKLKKEKDEVQKVCKPVSREPKTFVPVHRTKEIEAVRSKLPIIAEEQVIMESITENPVTVLAGETGSGKTTQVPQFLYEAGYTLHGKLIGITEPRRVAAISMSKRVAEELNLSSEIVSYQIRFEGNVTPKTKIKFMTDGVLLKEMERDFLLSKYSAICIDEAHERSLFTDILIGLLSRCVSVRQKRDNPLKLIIMSATMRVEDFVENPILFKSPPQLINIPVRQFPVQIHFSKLTPDNYLVAACKKAVQIHRKLPPGGILIFLTGQQEVKTLVKQLMKIFTTKGTAWADEEASTDPKQLKKIRKLRRKGIAVPVLKKFDLDKVDGVPLKADEEEEDDDSENEDDEDIGFDWRSEAIGPIEPLHVLPLYSMLPSKDQQKVFEPPPEGSRLCVVATNVAETSLTIPSIRYVVDCGRVKQKVWDKLTGVQQFKVSWESKASAEQRAGRAGRTGPGHCYRLYSSAVFDSDFERYSAPEIQVRPVDDMMLLMKSMEIDRVQNFPYPTHPGETQLLAAEKILIALGALEPAKKVLVKVNQKNETSTITELGKTIARFPIGPRFSKMLSLSFHHALAEYAIALVSALTVQEVFLDSSLHESSKAVKSKWSMIRKRWAGVGSSLLLGDSMVLLRAVGAFEYEGGSQEFCLKMGLRYKAMMEIRKLRRQLTTEVNTLVQSSQEIPLNPQMKPPSDQEATLLRQILLSGLPDKIARRITETEIKDGEDPKVYKNAYRCGELEEPVFIHSSSVLRIARPDWVVYQEVFESNEKLYIRGISAIQPEWIPIFGKSLCRFENPLQEPPPFYDEADGKIKCWVKASYGKQAWTLPLLIIEHPPNLDKYKLLAQFILSGDIFPKLGQWSSKLLSLPGTMTKSWAKLQPRTQTFLQPLTSNDIQSRFSLEQKWKEDRTFLLKEYLQWLPQDVHKEVEKNWPPLE